MWRDAKGSWIVPLGPLERMGSLPLAAPTGCGEGPSGTHPQWSLSAWAAPAGCLPRGDRRGTLRQPFPARDLCQKPGAGCKP